MKEFGKTTHTKQALRFSPIKTPDVKKESLWEKTKAQTDAQLRKEAEWCDFFIIGGGKDSKVYILLPVESP